LAFTCRHCIDGRRRLTVCQGRRSSSAALRLGLEPDLDTAIKGDGSLPSGRPSPKKASHGLRGTVPTECHKDSEISVRLQGDRDGEVLRLSCGDNSAAGRHQRSWSQPCSIPQGVQPSKTPGKTRILRRSAIFGSCASPSTAFNGVETHLARGILRRSGVAPVIVIFGLAQVDRAAQKVNLFLGLRDAASDLRRLCALA
jgi:hypothetical protein